MEQLTCKHGHGVATRFLLSIICLPLPSAAVRIFADVSDATLTVHPHSLRAGVEEEANKRGR